MEDIPGKFWCRYYICKTLIETSKITMTLSHFNSIPFFSANNIHETHYLIRDHTGGKFCNIVPFKLYLQWNGPVFKFLDHYGYYNNPPGVWFLLPVILILIRVTTFWTAFTGFGSVNERENSLMAEFNPETDLNLS